MPRRSPTPTALDEEAFAERRRLVELLENLSEADWDHDSLCAGWRVREVVAHMTMPFRTGPLSMLAGLVKARFSFDTFADSAARRDTAMYDSAQLLDLLRQNVTTVWHPPGGGEDGALSHDLIHGLDITEPLGLPAPPADRIGLVLRHGERGRWSTSGALLAGRSWPPMPTRASDRAPGSNSRRRTSFW